MKNFNFVTDGSRVYRFGNNDWYAVMQDNEKVMLVDTDCHVNDDDFVKAWSDSNDPGYESAANGQNILNFANYIAYKYFGDLSYAIIPREIKAGTGRIENAYMWPMSIDELKSNPKVSSRIIENSDIAIWTRTFSQKNMLNGFNYAWCLINPSAESTDECIFEDFYTTKFHGVAPTFYLRKDAIDHITDDGEIILTIPKTATTKKCENHLFNAIVAWYDDNIYEYNGLDDPDFIDRVCGRTGLSRNEYFSLMF